MNKIIIEIPELEKREHDNIFELNDSYNGEVLLSEVHDLALKITSFPEDDVVDYSMISDWHYCNIFGYRYTHGLIGDVKTDVLNIKRKYMFSIYETKYGKTITSSADVDFDELKKIWKENNNEFHYIFLKTKQDKILEKIKERYLNYDIIASLKAFGIDPVKFWYVFLWIRDYVYTRTISVSEMADTPLVELKKFVKYVKNNTERHGHFFYGDLILKSRYKKQNALKLENAHSIEIIAELIENYLDKGDMSEYSEDWAKLHNSFTKTYSPEIFAPEVTKDLGQTYQLFLFNKCMQLYLKDKKGTRHLLVGDVLPELKDSSVGKSEEVSVDKTWLITRLACIAGFDYEEILCNAPDNKRKLKDKLKNFNESSYKNYFSGEYTY